MVPLLAREPFRSVNGEAYMAGLSMWSDSNLDSKGCGCSVKIRGILLSLGLEGRVDYASVASTECRTSQEEMLTVTYKPQLVLM